VRGEIVVLEVCVGLVSLCILLLMMVVTVTHVVVLNTAVDGCDCHCCCRVAVVGNVDAGKSTLLGVLTHGELDNGRGFARQKLFRHKHEMESGRTSSVGNDILGFDAGGNVVNKPEHGHLDWIKICEDATKVGHRT
jgi:GTPase